VQDYARILPAEVFDSERERSTKYRCWTTNLQLASFGIRQKVDVLYSLSQFVERCSSAPEEGLAVDCGFHAPRIAIEQPYRKHVLETGDDVRNGRLSQSELCCCFGHAAVLHDSKKDLQVPEFETAAYTVLRRNL
jgi:hypothetical protein